MVKRRSKRRRAGRASYRRMANRSINQPAKAKVRVTSLVFYKSKWSLRVSLNCVSMFRVKVKPVELPIDKLLNSVSTTFQWQKAFSKGNQKTDIDVKQSTVLESDFIHGVDQVERTIEEVGVIIHKIFQRVRYAGFTSRILPHLHEVLVLATSLFEKINTEAARLGIIKRKLTLPGTSIFSTTTEMANHINLQYQVCSKLFKSILAFAKRYINNTYSVTLYVNMARLINAEVELNELHICSRDLLREVNFLRL